MQTSCLILQHKWHNTHSYPQSPTPRAPWLLERRCSLTNLLWQQCGVSFWPCDCKGSVFSGHVRAHWRSHWGGGAGGSALPWRRRWRAHTLKHMRRKGLELHAKAPQVCTATEQWVCASSLEVETPAGSSSCDSVQVCVLGPGSALPSGHKVSKFSAPTPETLSNACVLWHNAATSHNAASCSAVYHTCVLKIK